MPVRRQPLRRGCPSLRTKVLVTGRVRRVPTAGRAKGRLQHFDHWVPGLSSSVLDLEGVYAAMEGDTLDYLAEIRGE